MAKRLAIALWIALVIAVVVSIAYANRPRVLVDATPACAPKVNPCAKIDCSRPSRGYLA